MGKSARSTLSKQKGEMNVTPFELVLVMAHFQGALFGPQASSINWNQTDANIHTARRSETVGNYREHSHIFCNDEYPLSCHVLQI